MEPKTEKRFHNLSLEQVRALDKVLTEVILIHGRGNFPTLQVRAKDIIRLVKDRLVERDIQVKDIRLNGATASHVLVRDNGLGYRDLDIIFGVELPRQEDFQVIKEVVLGSLRDLLPCGVNRRKITFLTMKEAYVQKMVKVFNEHDRWSLISLSNNRAKTVGLKFVSSLRRQFEFSVDSFQIILDRMLESYWESERKQEGKLMRSAANSSDAENAKSASKETKVSGDQEESRPDVEKDSVMETETGGSCPDESLLAKELPPEPEHVTGEQEVQQGLESQQNNLEQEEEDLDASDDAPSKEDTSETLEPCEENADGKELFLTDYPVPAQAKSSLTDTRERVGLNLQGEDDHKVIQPLSPTKTSQTVSQYEKTPQLEVPTGSGGTETTTMRDSHSEYSFPPPAKKTCSMSKEIVPDFCPSPKLQRKMSRKQISKPEKWTLLTDLSDLTTQVFPPIEIPKPAQPNPPLDCVHGSEDPCLESEHFENRDTPSIPTCSRVSTLQEDKGPCENPEQTVKPKHSKKPPDLVPVSPTGDTDENCSKTDEVGPDGSWIRATGESLITVEAECMYGDFEQAMDHLRHRLIATHNPEEIRGGGLLKYSDLLVRNFRPASETEIKSLERYMCSRFFIDFPDVSEQQRKIEAYLQCHFVGNEETSKYDYLMTLRRVINESTVCLMGHERRQTLNMITVLALRVLGEQNAIPNTANVTCFYQPAPYVTEPIYNSYFITQAQPPLVYHPYPLQVHMQSGLV